MTKGHLNLFKSMKILHNIDLDSATRISSKKSPRQLLRISNHTYAILLMDRTSEPLIAFESERFSLLLETVANTITDVKVRQGSKEEPITIVLYTESGDCYSLDSDGQTWRGFVASQHYTRNLQYRTPMDLWGLPNRHPYCKMLLSATLAKHLEKQQEEQPPELTLCLIWKIFDQLRSDPGISVGDWLYVSAEECRFAALEHPRGIVFFHDLHESPQK